MRGRHADRAITRPCFKSVCNNCTEQSKATNQGVREMEGPQVPETGAASALGTSFVGIAGGLAAELQSLVNQVEAGKQENAELVRRIQELQDELDRLRPLASSNEDELKVPQADLDELRGVCAMPRSKESESVTETRRAPCTLLDFGFQLKKRTAEPGQDNLAKRSRCDPSVSVHGGDDDDDDDEDEDDLDEDGEQLSQNNLTLIAFPAEAIRLDAAHGPGLQVGHASVSCVRAAHDVVHDACREDTAASQQEHTAPKTDGLDSR